MLIMVLLCYIIIQKLNIHKEIKQPIKEVAHVHKPLKPVTHYQSNHMYIFGAGYPPCQTI